MLSPGVVIQDGPSVHAVSCVGTNNNITNGNSNGSGTRTQTRLTVRIDGDDGRRSQVKMSIFPQENVGFWVPSVQNAQSRNRDSRVALGVQHDAFFLFKYRGKLSRFFFLSFES